MRNCYLEASSIVVKGRGYVTDLILSDTATGGKIILYDGYNDKGKKIGTFSVGDCLTIAFSLKTYIEYETGLYAVLSGTAATVNIGYRADNT